MSDLAPTTISARSGNWRTLLIVVGAVIIIGLLFALAQPPADNPDDAKSASSYSAAQDGSLALYIWLGKSYQVSRLEYSSFDIPNNIEALFVINPTSDFSQIERRVLLDWLEAGHTLVWVETGLETSKLLQEWGISLNASTRPLDTLIPLPKLENPPVKTVQVRTGSSLDMSKAKVVATTYLADGSAVVLTTFRVGKGRVYLSTSPYLFSNIGLKQTTPPDSAIKNDNAAMILNLLKDVPLGSQIALDEIHHGYVGNEDLAAVLVNTRWGWGVLYALVLIALYFILSGRRFGRIVPLVPPDTRRSSAEYVEAVGSLFRRAAQRNWAIDHYRTTLRADLARPFGLDPALPASRMTDELSRVAPPFDRLKLLTLLNQLDSPLNPISGHAYNEADLLAISQQVAEVRRDVLG